MIEDIGPCSTRSCSNVGRRARGAQDIAGFASRTRVFVRSYYCQNCVREAAQRSLVGSARTSLRGRIAIPGGYVIQPPAQQRGDAPFGES